MKQKLFCIVLLFIPLVSYGQLGTLDQTFATNGIFRYGDASNFGWSTGLALQDDQKIIWCGGIQFYNAAIMRLHSNGTTDSSFGNNGISLCNLDLFDLGYTYPSSAGHNVAIQDDDKIVIGGNNEDNDKAVIERFEKDGKADTSFGNAGLLYIGAPQQGSSYSVAIHNQKIIVAGAADNKMFVIRRNEDGTPDTSFNETGKRLITFDSIGYSYAYAYALAIDSSDRIILAGHSLVQGTTYGALVRLNWDGSLDTTFAGDGMLLVLIPTNLFYLFDVKVQADGKIVAVGHTNPTGNYDRHLVAMRLNIDGTLDSTFASDGIFEYTVHETFANAVTIQPDQKIVIAGNGFPPAATDVLLMRLNTTGEPDSTFGTNGVVFTHVGVEDYVSTIVLQQDGKLLVTGYTEDPFGQDTIFILRYNMDFPTAVTFAENTSALLLYPNPVHSVLTLILRNPGEGIQSETPFNDVTVRVYDLQGRMQNCGFQIFNCGLNNTFQLNTENLQDGFYALQITDTTGRSVVGKFVKQ